MKSYSQLMQERISVAVGTTARDVMIGVLESLKSDRDNFCRAVPAELKMPNVIVLDANAMNEWLGFPGGVDNIKFEGKVDQAMKNLAKVLNRLITAWDAIKHKKDIQKKLARLYSMFAPIPPPKTKKGKKTKVEKDTAPEAPSKTISCCLANLQGKLILWNLILFRILDSDSHAVDEIYSASIDNESTMSMIDIQVQVHVHLFGRSAYARIGPADFDHAGNKKGLMVLGTMFVEFVTNMTDMENLLHILRDLTDLNHRGEIDTPYLSDDVVKAPKSTDFPLFTKTIQERDIQYIIRLFVNPASILNKYFVDAITDDCVIYTKSEKYLNKTNAIKNWKKKNLPAKRITSMVVATVNSAWLKIIRLTGPVIYPTQYGNVVCDSK